MERKIMWAILIFIVFGQIALNERDNYLDQKVENFDSDSLRRDSIQDLEAVNRKYHHKHWYSNQWVYEDFWGREGN